MIQVEAVKRGSEAVRVTFAADFSICDDVETCRFLLADGQQRGIVLRLLKPWWRDAPEFCGTNSRRHLMPEFLAIDQPLGLWVGADEGRRQQHGKRSILRVEDRVKRRSTTFSWVEIISLPECS